MNTHPLFSEFSNQWRQNPKLRLGGWLILVILLTYLFLLLSDREAALKKDYRNMSARLERLDLLARQKEWVGRADAVRAFVVQMEGRFWKASSRGLAQAKVQIWVDNLLAKKGITDARTQVEPARDMTGYESVWQVGARLEAPFAPHKLTDLLHTLETHRQIVTVEQLDVLNTNRPRFTLVFKAYFQANSER